MQGDQLYFYHRLGRVLEDRRKSKSMSRRQLSEQMGDPDRSHSCYHYERAISRPSVWWLMQWCHEMGMTIEEVIAEAAREEDLTQPSHAEWPEGKPP